MTETLRVYVDTRLGSSNFSSNHWHSRNPALLFILAVSVLLFSVSSSGSQDTTDSTVLLSSKNVCNLFTCWTISATVPQAHHPVQRLTLHAIRRSDSALEKQVMHGDPWAFSLGKNHCVLTSFHPFFSDFQETGATPSRGWSVHSFNTCYSFPCPNLQSAFRSGSSAQGWKEMKNNFFSSRIMERWLCEIILIDSMMHRAVNRNIHSG